MKIRFRQAKNWFVPLAVFLCIGLLTGPASAVEVLQNTSFESYDAGTLVPGDWQVLDGNVAIYADQASDGSVSVYSPGGTMIEEVDTPNPPQSGTLVQLIDLSTIADWSTANWLNLSMSFNYRLWGATRMYMYLEYLPSSYNGSSVTADDPAWSGADVTIASMRTGTSHARSSYPWRSTSDSNIEIPKVKWARVRFVYDVVFKSSNHFEDGPYYIAIDDVSVDAAVIVPDAPCTGNLLTNPGFESVSSGVPADWYVRAGRMTALERPLPPYAGDYHAGNIGGYVDPNPGGDPINYPDEPQYGSLVQLVDLSTIADWADASFLSFSFSNRYLRKGISGLNAVVEYLPPDYNTSAVTWDDAAWDSDAMKALDMAFSNTSGLWKFFQTDQGTLPKVRWVRVRLDVDSIRNSINDGEYIGGFDHVCFQAASVMAEDLIKNPSFDNRDENNKPIDWHEDPDDGPLHLQFEPVLPYDGAMYLFKYDDGEGDSTGRVYQVIDLADKIPGWTGVDPMDGSTVENQFIMLSLGAHLFNLGGTGVKVGLEYLPYSYNTVDGITWDHEAWQPRAWTSDGTAFTNSGGDAIDLGALIEDATVFAGAPPWREVSYDGWLPRVRWIRLRIELDATVTTGNSWVAIDALEMSAMGTQWGPYSGFGNLPEATFYEDPNAPDKAIPAWVGPEGDGISGGYTGQTQRNYVNPAFAGFADNYASYIPSGENIYNELFMEPMAITGSPWNDAGWNYVIITLGDLSLANQADYFSPAPSGTYQPGEITATFDECPIINGPGHDFATFENGFSSGWTSPWIFAELAYVEVSSNGTDFIRFPTHSLTPKWPGSYGTILASGVFGVTGKHINAYGDQWGTPFDLDWIADHPLVLNGTVDLNDIRYVRQVDIPGGGPSDAMGLYTGFFFDSYGNVIFDSWPTWGSGGVDLDAVAVINTSATDSDGDHIVDYWDNCSQTGNDNQYDTDEDGYGNMCDCDIDGEEGGDGTVGLADYYIFYQAWGSHGPERIPGAPGEPDTYSDPSPNWNPDADFNGDNVVGLEDYYIFYSRWGSAAPFH